MLLAGQSLSGCHASAGPDPAAVYQGIYDDYLHGNLDAARANADKARKELSTAGSRANSTWELRFRLLQAEILFKQNHLDGTLSLLTDGASFPAEGDLAIKRDLLLGLSQFYLGQTQDSARELAEARRLAETSHSPLMGELLRAEATVQRRSGDLDKATETFASSLAAAREHHDLLLQANDLVDLGLVSLQSGHYDQALGWSLEAERFAGSIQARRQLQWALGNKGWAYQNLGDFEHALHDFQAAGSLAKELGMSGSRLLWLQDAGLADYKLGNLEEARTYDEEALQSALSLPTSSDDQIANIRTNLALLLYDQGQYDAAKSHSEAAVLAARNSKDGNVVAYARFLQGLIASRQPADRQAERMLNEARESATDLDLRTDVDIALANLYAGKRRPRQAELWYGRAIETFEDKRSSVHDEALRLSAFAYGDGAYRDYAEFLIDSKRPNEALQLLDRSRARTLEEGLGFASAESAAPAKKVANARAIARNRGAVILFYSLGQKKSHLWAISGRHIHLFDLPAQKDLRSLVDEYQRVIQKSVDPLQSANPAALALFEALIRPAAAMIPGGSQVIVIPDGILNALNFETLLEPTSEGLKYWIENVTVTTTSSIRILSRLTAGSADAAAQNLLLIGDPVSSGPEFQALPSAATEIERIRGHFPAEYATVLTQAQAVPAAYAASRPERFRYIHFVAHGTASRLSPLDSAVILSPDSHRPAEFKLYARDIVRHPLHARLVTISACYGSGLRSYAGEGLVGLAWAFLRAGSHTVIGALWQADDASTPLLMDRLYAELEAGQSPAAALRAAKLAMIHSTNVYRKPFYWGVFQLYAGA